MRVHANGQERGTFIIQGVASVSHDRPWRGRVDFCRWHGADHFVLSKVRVAGDDGE